MHRPLLLSLFLGAASAALAEPASPLRLAALSADLYAQGVETADPLTILTAARLRKSAAPDLAPEDPLSWQSMLAAASALAGDDPAVAALAADIAAETAKGAIAGAVIRRGDADPGETPLLALDFEGGAYAEVYVEAAPGTDINIFVRDADGNVVCEDRNTSFVAYCGWTPSQDGSFTLTVENRSTAPTEYSLMTN